MKVSVVVKILQGWSSLATIFFNTQGSML